MGGGSFMCFEEEKFPDIGRYIIYETYMLVNNVGILFIVGSQKYLQA